MNITSPLHTYTLTYAHGQTRHWDALMKTTHDDCESCRGSARCITELSYKEHTTELHTSTGWSGRSPDSQRSSAWPIGWSDELILIWRSHLIGWAASVTLTCKTQPYLEAVKRAFFPLPKRRHFSVCVLWRTERCYQTMLRLFHALLCLRWSFASFPSNGVCHREEWLKEFLDFSDGV